MCLFDLGWTCLFLNINPDFHEMEAKLELPFLYTRHTLHDMFSSNVKPLLLSTFYFLKPVIVVL